MRNTRAVFGCLGLVLLTAGSLTLAAQRRQPMYTPMSGTYELESTRGDNLERAAQAATRALPGQARDRAYQSLLIRMTPPQTLAIDRNGRMVTISSSSGPRATFDADGQTRSEPGPRGRMITTRASFVGDRLVVSTSGNRDTDFSVTFEPLNRGAGLRVTRRLDSEEFRQPVTVQSYYRRVANEPRWDLYSQRPEPAMERMDRVFVVPDGAQLMATLDTPLSTRTSQSGERFTMTVRQPREFEGARIDGVVSGVSAYGRAGNRADMRVRFETIQLRGDRPSEFSAVLNAVRTPDGNTVRVDPEGGVRGATPTDTRIEHGALGAALGAIVGAIAGGGKGAAIGAVVGGAGGAILVEGRDRIDLPPGTEVTLTVIAPRYRMP